MDLLTIDLTDPTLFASGRADAIFEMLRREAPVYWHPAPEGGQRFWVVSRYQDVVSVLRRPEVFSSEFGNILPTHETRDPTAGLMTFTTDPPAHTRLRALLARGLSPRLVVHSRPLIRQIVSHILEPVRAGATLDFMRVVAEQLPVATACGLMGVPEADWSMVKDLTHVSHGMKEDAELVELRSSRTGFSSANTELLAYFSQLVSLRRREPGDDLISVVVQAEHNGEGMSDEEVAVNCFALTLGGYQADRNAMGGGLMALIQYPDQFDLLVQRPSVIPSAVEEILRWTTPTLNLARVALRDTEIDGVPVRRGDRVSAWLISANRDEEVFPDPYRFLVTRNPNRHLTFGNGNHFCAGAGVARLELETLLEELLGRGVHPELAGEPVPIQSHFQQGFKQLPVRFVER
jgi:cytochrome P450